MIGCAILTCQGLLLAAASPREGVNVVAMLLQARELKDRSAVACRFLDGEHCTEMPRILWVWLARGSSGGNGVLACTYTRLASTSFSSSCSKHGSPLKSFLIT